MRRWSSSRFRLLIVSVVAGCAVSLGSSLVVQGPVANAATRTVNIAYPGTALSYPGQQIDAEIDSGRKTITIVQRSMYGRSQVTAHWVNTRTGRSGATGLPGFRQLPGALYPDRFAVLPTGPGPVLVWVTGRVEGRTGLIPTGSGSFGFLPPNAKLITV